MPGSSTATPFLYLLLLPAFLIRPLTSIQSGCLHLPLHHKHPNHVPAASAILTGLYVYRCAWAGSLLGWYRLGGLGFCGMGTGLGLERCWGGTWEVLRWRCWGGLGRLWEREPSTWFGKVLCCLSYAFHCKDVGKCMEMRIRITSGSRIRLTRYVQPV